MGTISRLNGYIVPESVQDAPFAAPPFGSSTATGFPRIYGDEKYCSPRLDYLFAINTPACLPIREQI